jgi:hypothetical protein
VFGCAFTAQAASTDRASVRCSARLSAPASECVLREPFKRRDDNMAYLSGEFSVMDLQRPNVAFRAQNRQ